MRPVTTVPRPAIEKVSSTGITKSFSVSRFGVGMNESTWPISSSTASLPSLVAAQRAGAAADEEDVVAGKSCIDRSSRTSISTSSSS